MLGMGCAFLLQSLAESVSQISASNWDAFSSGSSTGNCVPESSLRVGRAFRWRRGAESVSRNLSNSVIRGLSERRANDAKRKTYNENGVKTTLRTA